jgi:WXXGXW repeat (2 copies)
MTWRTPLLLALCLAPALVRAQAAPAAEPEPPEVQVDAKTAPPPDRVETQPARPSATHVWIAGHWKWEAGAYAWIPGHWAPPPAPGYLWIPDKWVQHGGIWYFREGHWKPAPSVPAPSVTVQTAPPAAIVETRPASPYAGAVWMPGYWSWNGAQYVWVAGSWVAPRPGYLWVPGHWRGTPYGWRWVRGHWRRV